MYLKESVKSVRWVTGYEKKSIIIEGCLDSATGTATRPSHMAATDMLQDCMSATCRRPRKRFKRAAEQHEQRLYRLRQAR